MTGAEVTKWLAIEPQVNDVMNSVISTKKFPRAYYKDFYTSVALARKFNDEVVKPVYKEIDLKVKEDNDYLPWEFVHEANRWKLYSLWMPKAMGGGGLHINSLYVFLEEIASVCVGLSNVIGVHYLGLGTLLACWNMKVFKRIMNEIREGEKKDKPCLVSLGLTEPGAGTDVEDQSLLVKARLGTTAQKTKGGYILNGQKCFISSGHLSTWHMVVAYGDRKKPTDTAMVLAVRSDMPGFSFGSKENKMGQKACVASELVFEDCFVPDELVCVCPEQFANWDVDMAEVNDRVLISALSASRIGVGAFATGVARGAFETALDYAQNKKVAGKRLIDHEWAQVILAEMYKNVNMARAMYLEAAFAIGNVGMLRVLYNKLIFHSSRLPVFPLIAPFFDLKLVTNVLRRIYFKKMKKSEVQVMVGWASLSKFGDSDISVENSKLAIELMGFDGARHDIGAEKYLRDAKLLQIYEGTNQLNRLEVFKNLAGRNSDFAFMQ
ncbi:MAG: acyl-CoA dehydrogenase family protein [Acidobacteriota bacterium]